MSPNEHYREAERLLVLINEAETRLGWDDESPAISRLTAAAQVHATLATLGKRDEA